MLQENKQLNSWEEAVRWLRCQDGSEKLVREAYYDDPLVDAAERYTQSEEWQAVRKLLPKAGSALDVGAGRGIASYALAKEGFFVSALEPDPSELVGAGAIRSLFSEAKLPITVVQHFSECLPFADASFEIVFARAVLHHTQNLEMACKEYVRVLRPGGVFIAIREHVISRHADKQAFLDTHPLHHLYGGEDAFLLSDYLRAIESSGLQIAKVLDPFASPINFAPYSLKSLQQEIALRISRYLPYSANISVQLMSVPLIWQIVRRILNLFDNRPGRLYSFIAVKGRT
jgi:SAM-dependent methyltransferase